MMMLVFPSLMLATTRLFLGLLARPALGRFPWCQFTRFTVRLSFCAGIPGHGLIRPGHRMVLAYFVVDPEFMLYFPVILEAHQLAGWPFARVVRLALLAE